MGFGEYLGNFVGGVKQGIGGIFSSPGDQQERDRKKLLQDQAAAAGGFAGTGEAGFGALSGQSDAARQNLADQASGKLSYSREALRQGLEQNLAGQRSLAAGASPLNAPMAARTAAIQSARLGSGLAGQQALAGIAEQQGAAKAYADATLAQRQQDLAAALQSRQNAIQGYGAQNAGTPEKGFLEKYGPMIIGGLKAGMG